MDLRRVARDAGLSIDDSQLLLRSGLAKRLIVDTASELGAQLIVMGTHRPGGLERLLVGSTAEFVARHAQCPVLVIPCAQAEWRPAVASAG